MDIFNVHILFSKKIFVLGSRCKSNFECLMKDPNKPICGSDGMCRRGLLDYQNIGYGMYLRDILNLGWICRSDYDCRMKNPTKPICGLDGMCRRGLL